MKKGHVLFLIVIFMLTSTTLSFGKSQLYFFGDNERFQHTWDKHGKISKEGTTLKIYNTTSGNALRSTAYEKAANTRLDIAFQVNSDSFCQFGAGYEKYTGTILSTNDSKDNSFQIDNGTTIYKSLIFREDGIREYLCVGNFFDQANSTILYEDFTPMTEDLQKTIKQLSKKVLFITGDNPNATMILKDFIHYKNIVSPIKNSSSKNKIVAEGSFSFHNATHHGNNSKDIHIKTASPWAKDEINQCKKAGIETHHMMDSNYTYFTTREHFAELVMKMFEKIGGTSEQTNNPFTDTSNDSIIKAYNAGIIKGMYPDKFIPDGYLTREQLCVMIVNALQSAGKDYNHNISFTQNYEDMNQISSWAKESVQLLNGYGIVNGDGTKLSPKDNVTKEMAILMLYRAYEQFK